MPDKPYKRIVDLDSVDNFRDLGGYETRDGAQVQWRRLFRSGQLSEATDLDVDTLASLGIGEVHDLRRPEECERFPSRLPENIKVRHHALGIASLGAFTEYARAGNLNARAAEDMMIEGYRSLINNPVPTLSEFVRTVAHTNSHAILMHCLAGKDRTGIAAALLLLALGVPRETILTDYMLSAKYFQVDLAVDFVHDYLQRQGANVSREAIVPYCSVRESYLIAAFEEIDHQHGGVESYLYRSLELSDTDLENLRSNFLNGRNDGKTP